MPLYGQTWFTIKKAVARAAGDMVREGTATGGSTTTLIDTGKFIDATDNALKGVKVYIGNGSSQGTETYGTAFTAGSDTITTPTVTAMDNTSQYMLTRRFTHTDILDALRRVLWSQGPYAKRYIDQSLIAGSPLVNATFYDASGTFPNGWTAAGTGTYTQESTISKHGRYALKMVSTTTNACSQAQSVLNAGLYRGKSVQLKGWVYSNDASRAYLQLGDGVTTQQDFTGTSANRGWGSTEFSTTPFTLSDRASVLTATLGIVAGASTSTAYFSGIRITGYDWREWNVPAGSPSSIHAVRLEQYTEGPFGLLLARDAYSVTEESTKRLRINTSLPEGHIMEIVGRTGWTDLTAPTTDDDATYDGDPEGMICAAAAMLLQSKGDGSPADQARIANLKDLALAHGFRAAAVKPPAGSLLIERQP